MAKRRTRLAWRIYVYLYEPHYITDWQELQYLLWTFFVFSLCRAW